MGSDECVYHLGWQKQKTLYDAIYHIQIFLRCQFVLYNDKVLLTLPHHTEQVLNRFWKILLKLCPKELTLQSIYQCHAEAQNGWVYVEQINMGFIRNHM